MAHARLSDVRDRNTEAGPRAPWGAEPAVVLSVDKALLIVELLMREASPLTARAVGERLGINRSTAHRLLNGLLARGRVEKSFGTAAYRLSLRFLALARVSLQSRDFVAEVRPTLERLSRFSRETVHLGVLDGFDVVHVDKVDSPELVGVSSKVGTRAVPHLTGLGKALFAAGSDPVLEDYLAYAQTLPPPYALDDPERLRAEIRLTRQRGYSIDDEETSVGVRCLGVAVRGAGDVPIFAISLTGPSPRFTPERVAECAPELLTTARSLSRQFGWEPRQTESFLPAGAEPIADLALVSGVARSRPGRSARGQTDRPRHLAAHGRLHPDEGVRTGPADPGAG